MNKQTIKQIRNEIDRLETVGTISKADAERIDELIEGELFESVIKNAYTEVHSVQQFDLTLSVLKDLLRKEIVYSKEKSLEIIDKAISAVDRLDSLTDIETNPIVVKILSSDMIKFVIDNKLIVFKDLSIKDIPEVLDQIEDLVGKDITREAMAVYESRLHFDNVHGVDRLIGVIDYGTWLIEKKNYRNTLDNMRTVFVENNYITSRDVGFEFDDVDSTIAAIEIAIVFNTSLREDIIKRYKEEHAA